MARLLRYSQVVAITIASSFALLPASSTFAANSVPTKRVLVPEEKADSEKPVAPPEEPSEEAVSDRIIPNDALPQIDPIETDEAILPGQETEPDPNARSPRDEDLPVVRYDLTSLPQPVQRIRDLILEAAKSGDIEKLRNLLGTGETATSLSIGGLDGDPIQFLKEASGDNEGFEILAILIEVLEAGFVHMDAGTEEEMYIWPYFFSLPLADLTPPQKVELYRILTAGDVEDSVEFGSYVFYRLGIKPDGQWNFFVAGD